MPHRLQDYKPAAPARLHLLLAALLWTVVGTLLLCFGAAWTWTGGGPWGPWLLLAAVIVGLLKGRYLLAKTAARTIQRIRQRGDGRCLGGFLSWRSWLFVLAMMAFGRILRAGWVPHAVVGFI
jgi:hypothetical protein